MADLPSLFHDGTWREIRLDMATSVKPDIVASMTDMREVPDDFADALLSSHNIEHVYWHEVPKALGEFKRVIKPGGFVCIYCPDIQLIGEKVSEGDLLATIYDSPSGPITPMDFLYGLRPSLASGAHSMAHKCAFAQPMLFDLLKQAGFARFTVRRLYRVRELLAVAIKAPVGQFTAKAVLDRLVETDRRPIQTPPDEVQAE